ncbi:hypothetical protein FHX82_000850 [Amycolatopsis bartoniae]|uniref:ESX-1 secretion-associated protein n=1 Tax=Amycolatopsis bartoniae TaxID=941986 RepID=A0A8H9J7T8_9PSEU|nr:type VII secretion target [Amycolatopsis bartoniae]MBB2933830.1 hypothetical protein [Amycolatopsis bartoniae]TVT10515.1 ESX-1 secretion-associated protein [Amycolatopsis bartoniae]GHF87606.1 hypothetical protein GCM10017566_71810 [Amycolatopsis bartoniae]
MSFDVDANELRQYAGKLDAQRGTAGEIAGLVSKADVSDKSWGVVGLFVKQKYTGMLADLNDLFTDLQEGLQSGAEKFRGAADGYQAQEDAVKDLLKGFQLEIEGH